MLLIYFLLFSCQSLAHSFSNDCEKATKKYYQDKAFSICRNFMAGHDIYFAPNCPVNLPRNCIEPTPSEFTSFESKHVENTTSEGVTKSFYDANDSRITYSNMTAVRERLHNRIHVSKTGHAISMDCLKCWEFEKQKELWAKHVDNIERVAGFSFLSGRIRTVLEFGCGTGGFLAEMASRGVHGICTARDKPTEDGLYPELPYLGTVASRGLLAMHISITEHQPFISKSFGFIHCSWVLAYVDATAKVYSSIMLEWDRLLVPGGLVFVQGAWSKGKDNNYMTKLYAFTKYLLEKVLNWKILAWEVTEQKRLGLVLSFTAMTPMHREIKDWSTDKFLLDECPKCF